MTTTRRKFIASSAVAAAGISMSTKVLSAPFIANKRNANNTIRMGFIGIGNRGSQLLNWFRENKDVEVAALCDVYAPCKTRNRSEVAKRYLETGKVPKMGEDLGSKVKRYEDFRKLLEQKDIDAVCIATPDHWHAIQAIQAMEAGKDVYVEKPLTITIKEGRALVNAQKRTSQVCAVGLNRRGSSIYQHLAKEVQNDLIGKVTTARAQRTSNMYPNGIGRLSPEAPPKDFNWDMWLGPRPMREYQYNMAPYYFRWWKEYSSQMGNWGVHYMDVIRWMVGEKAPTSISAHGGKYAVNDDRTIPDTMEVLFEFDSGTIIKFSIHEANGGGRIQGGEVELNGTKGNLIADQNGYNVVPARSGQFQSWKELISPKEEQLEGNAKFGDLAIKEDSSARLVRNFLDCVKSKEEPWCPLEEGHRSTSFAHLANIALEVGGRIEWDAENEKITNNKKANELLHYEYRKPWAL
ncbi:MAG: Gfo/Idh/MocA family oxidoreductase [Cyclobacteriaceae bacterium]|nr:Gfo/Idh/MocA family oxidoreductase [Cyclobacteriaceae bacterium]